MLTECSPQDSQQITFWDIGRQQLTADLYKGDVSSAMRGYCLCESSSNSSGLSEILALRFPDPRHPLFITHSVEDILTQNVYQFLAGYFDANDAQVLRTDPLFLTLVGTSPDQEDAALASGSTLSRFQYAYTRRQHQTPRKNVRRCSSSGRLNWDACRCSTTTSSNCLSARVASDRARHHRPGRHRRRHARPATVVVLSRPLSAAPIFPALSL